MRSWFEYNNEHRNLPISHVKIIFKAGTKEVCKVCHKFIRILNTNPDINLGRFHRNQSNILRYNSERIVDAVDGCTRFIVRRLGLIGSKGLQGIFTNRKNDPFGKFRCSRIITTYTLRNLPISHVKIIFKAGTKEDRERRWMFREKDDCK